MKRVYLFLFIGIISGQIYGKNNDEIRIRHLIKYVDNKIGVYDQRWDECIIGLPMSFAPSTRRLKRRLGEMMDMHRANRSGDLDNFRLAESAGDFEIK